MFNDSKPLTSVSLVLRGVSYEIDLWRVTPAEPGSTTSIKAVIVTGGEGIASHYSGTAGVALGLAVRDVVVNADGVYN